ncbi:KH homology domain-containing protein 1-like [Heterocephalus glaber]|uniref:KH homology domain-containing protein 1-like n=1 Tax=Heterocephalus glaber TaxID=10181 RepID=A0AAX6PUV3_HETGA|nr:KH homology domain-containing protein 1-like [Heterocephalus glaber]
MESGAGGGGRAWWTVAEHFQAPLVFYVDAEQEELVFGREDSDLRRIEEHSHTLIQLEAWATAAGQTRVTVVGPPGAQRWLWELLCSLGSGEPGGQARGHAMLQLVRSRPLSWAELAAAGREQHQVGNMSPAA